MIQRLSWPVTHNTLFPNGVRNLLTVEFMYVQFHLQISQANIFHNIRVNSKYAVFACEWGCWLNWKRAKHSSLTHTRTNMHNYDVVIVFFATIRCPVISAASLEGQQINCGECCTIVGGGNRSMVMWRWRQEGRGIVYIPLKKVWRTIWRSILCFFFLFFFSPFLWVPKADWRLLVIFHRMCVCVYLCVCVRAHVRCVCVIAVESAG